MSFLVRIFGALLCLSMTACGGAKPSPAPKTASADPCAGGPSLTVTGTVKGFDLKRLKTPWFMDIKTMTMIVFTEKEEPCAQHAALTAVLALCDQSTGDFEVTKQRRVCKTPGQRASTIVERPDGIDIANGESGQVTLEHRGANCIAGRFSMKMGEAQVSGRFVAPRCNTVKKLGH